MPVDYIRELLRRLYLLIREEVRLLSESVYYSENAIVLYACRRIL